MFAWLCWLYRYEVSLLSHEEQCWTEHKFIWGPPSRHKIHAFTQKFFVIHAFTQVFLEIHANPIFREIGKIFGNNRENCQKCTNLGEKGKFTGSSKKLGRFTHSRNRKMEFHAHASLFNSRIHAIFFRFSRIHATKKAHSRIHANRWGAPINH